MGGCPGGEAGAEKWAAVLEERQEQDAQARERTKERNDAMLVKLKRQEQMTARKLLLAISYDCSSSQSSHRLQLYGNPSTEAVLSVLFLA